MDSKQENTEKLVEEAARLVNDLAEANNAYAAAKERESIARSDTTLKLNRLNELQDEFDHFVSASKQAAPNGSDWANESTLSRKLYPAVDPEHS